MKIILAIKIMGNAAGGAERVLAFLANTLKTRGHDVQILSFDNLGAKSFYPINQDVKWECLSIGDENRKTTIPEVLPKILALRKHIKNQKPDVVIAFMHSMFIPVTFALLGTGIKVIASEHIVPKHYDENKIEFLFFKLAALFLKKITVLSEDVRRLYPKFIQKKMVPVPNPIYPNDALSDTVGVEGKLKTILSVGRLDPQKDQAILIDAFAALSQKFPDWNLKIVGEGNLRKNLEQQVKTYGLENRISLPGTTKDINKEYLQSHLFVLPSLYESFGMATAEAMSFGLPVIGFVDCPGTNELIKDGENGILVSTRSVQALADAMERLMISAEQRRIFGMRGGQSLEKFHPDKIANLWEELIRKETMTK